LASSYISLSMFHRYFTKLAFGPATSHLANLVLGSGI
jgi:hypothetical protein